MDRRGHGSNGLDVLAEELAALREQLRRRAGADRVQEDVEALRRDLALIQARVRRTAEQARALDQR